LPLGGAHDSLFRLFSAIENLPSLAKKDRTFRRQRDFPLIAAQQGEKGSLEGPLYKKVQFIASLPVRANP
jgi:hypothetical protein